MNDFDKQLSSWHSGLPPLMRDLQECPPNLRVAQGAINMHYTNLRILLYRPRLLICAMSKRPKRDVSDEDQHMVQKCRSLASASITYIDHCWFPHQLSIRDAAWFLLQACLIPLLSLAAEPEHVDRSRWRSDVEMTLRTLASTASWSVTVKRSYEAIASIYEATQNLEKLKTPTTLEHDSGVIWDANFASLWEDTNWEALPPGFIDNIGFSDYAPGSFDSTDAFKY